MNGNKTYFFGGHRTSSLFKKVQSLSTSVLSLFILTDTCFDAFHRLLHKTDLFSL